MQIRDYLNQLAAGFESAGLEFAHGTDNPLDEACFLVFSTLGLDYEGDETQLDRDLTGTELQLLESRARQRIEQRIPVAYLIGEAWFAGHRFFIDRRALIPRSPIGELIQRRFEPLLDRTPAKILDLGAGSGCIGIACALEFPAAEVDLSDISTAALDLALTNVQRYGLESRVRLIHSDLFASLPFRYDLIVSNPPYVPDFVVAGLPAEFNHEPLLGLQSPGQGLAIPLQILAEAADHLDEEGVLIMEVGCSAEALQERLPAVPFLWLEFEHGGDGVLLLTAKQLAKYRASFN
ncbi:MAG: 50S ribosomal protein L3 N(5)-glutamine methyltransferase [Pseudohongiellaceae bacterium]